MDVTRLFHIDRLCRAALIAVVSVAASRTLLAQQAGQVLRGTVRRADSTTVWNATVSVTPTGAPADQPPRVVRTDSVGFWTMRFQESAPFYTVKITALGTAPATITARPTADGQPIVVNVTLSRVVFQLDPVIVKASLRAPPPRDANGHPLDQAASERAADLIAGAVAAADKGNLAAMAGAVPGVRLITDAAGGPPGFSVLGLSPDQNSVTLNGIQFSGADIPRDAIALTRVTTTSFDVARGGFSGGQLAIAAFSGGNFHERVAHMTLDAPSLQVTDAVGRRLGTEYSNLQLSGTVSGPIMFDKLFYSVAAQGGRRSGDVPSLVSNDSLTLARVGVAPDSVQRLMGALDQLGVPFTTGGAPTDAHRDNASLLARVDWQPSPTAVGNLVASVRRNQSSALYLAPTALPSHGGSDRASGADVSGTLSAYLHKSILSDLRVGAHVDETRSAPYLDLPDARVLVTSRLDGGLTGISALQFGGNAALPRDSRRSGAELLEQVSWMSVSGRHRLRATADVRYDAFAQHQSANTRGSYFFASIADLEANRPASFVRTLSARDVAVSVINSALSFGDSWRPTDRRQILYGVRVEGTRFGDVPAANPAVASMFGLRTNTAPNELHVSPRVGVAWGVGQRGTKGLPGAPLVFLRAGVGEFRNSPAATLLAPAMRATGLAGATRLLQCVGSAVPRPDWNGFLDDPSTVPTECAGGAPSSFVTTQPNVVAIDPGFQSQRSWRGNLSVQGPLISKWVVFQVEGIYSRNLHQQSPVDLNFSPGTVFFLNAEGARPVYALPSSIVPATGALTNRDSRRAAEFGSVMSLQSALVSDSRQVIVTLWPVTFLPGVTWNVSYVNQRLRDESRGFGGSTPGNPLVTEWGRSALDARHQVNGSLTMRVRDLLSISLWTRLSSGTRFTPMVGSDINGDGLANDRAFVFSSADTDSSLRAGVTSLLAAAPSRVRSCLAAQTGSVAGRNSCTGPWTATSNAVVTLNAEKLGMQNRMTVSLSVQNVPAGVDALVHGTSRLHGWGQPAIADPTLLTVRGFDASTRQFRYEVNQRFGDTRPSSTVARAPFFVTLEARLQLGRIPVTQAIEQVMAPGRTRGSNRLGPAELRARLAGTVVDPIRQIMAVKDSLSIVTKEQLVRLSALQRRVGAQQDSIWTPVVEFLSKQRRDYDAAATMARVYEAQCAVFDGVVRAMREVKEILSPEQIRELPPFMLVVFDEKSLLVARPRPTFFPLY